MIKKFDITKLKQGDVIKWYEEVATVNRDGVLIKAVHDMVEPIEVILEGTVGGIADDFSIISITIDCPSRMSRVARRTRNTIEKGIIQVSEKYTSW